jgi:PAS domain S-box-containing protein
VQYRSAVAGLALPRFVPIATGALAAVIFAVDAFSPLSMAVAVLYVVVVVMAAQFCDRRHLIMVGVGCGLLTLLAFTIAHGTHYETAAFARALVSLAAIAITSFLAVQNKASEMILREQANLLEVTHDAIFVRDANDVIRYWNRGAEELYGWTMEEALGRVSHDFMHTALPQPMHEITAVLTRTGRWEGELVHTKRDGSTVAVASRWSLQRDERGQPAAVLETNNDVTERRRAENALRLSEAHLAEAQRLSLTGSFGWNSTSGDIIWSDETYRIFQLDPSEKPTLDFIVQRTHPADRPAVRQLLKQAPQQARNWDIEHRLLLPDGTIKHVSVVAHAEPPRNGTVEFIGAIMDVTGARRSEQELQQAQANLAHVNRVTTLGEMTASIAHEVSQPIAAMLANAGAGLRWLAAGNSEEVRQSLSRILKDGHRASDVISRIRALSKRMSPHRDHLNINDAITEVVGLTRAEAERSHTTVRAKLASGLPPVYADRVQVQQVILNLIVNAIEAVSNDSNGTHEVEVSSALDGPEGVLVTVRDSGAGLDPDQLSRVFEAFYTTKANGIGMGLAICRSIVEAHDGRLWASHNEPRGAAFQFSLRASSR